MLYEYALEPTLISNWKDFRYFTEKFSVAQGRLIARYPKRWKKMVYEALTHCGEIERKRIEDRLQTIDDRMMKRQGGWNSQLDWLPNAEVEHARRPFHAILAKTNLRQNEYVLEGDNISEEHPLWAPPQSPPVLREAREMATRVAPLLRVAETIVFVDPHFGPQHIRYRRPLEAFLLAILEQRYGMPPTKIEIHTNDELGPDFFRGECERCLPDIIPADISVRFIRWKQKIVGEKLHNRFILTDRGGVMFGVGLDDGDGAVGETDDIKLLDDETYKIRWQQYTSGVAFDLVDELTILGRRASFSKEIS